jgi:CheY-like chemotaxis protein
MGARLLLVDDDPDFVAINGAVLRKAGYTVLTASSGAECLRRARDEKPDLVILDMIMEGRQAGLEVSRELRAHEATRGIPLVMITSVNEVVPASISPDPVSLPVDVLMEKPVDPDLLLEAVAGVLSSRSRARKRILLVDDDADFLAMNRSVLLAAGYDVDTVSGAASALQRVAATRPDLVVTDLMMSGLDEGFTLARALKDDPATSRIPVIIVTAASSQRGYDFRPTDTRELEALGAEAFLDKPVTPTVLLGRIRELLR